MTRSIFNTQLTLSLKADYRKTVTNTCTKTQARKLFEQIQGRSAGSNLVDMRTYVNSQLQNKNDAKPHGLTELYSPENKG